LFAKFSEIIPDTILLSHGACGQDDKNTIDIKAFGRAVTVCRAALTKSQ